MMKPAMKIISGVMLSLLTTTTGLAATALFKDSVLHITHGIVAGKDGGVYYKDIQLQAMPNGDFRVIGARSMDLAPVEEATVAVINTQPPQVELQIRGYLPNPCIEREPVAVAREGDEFHVLVAMNVLQTLVACIQVIQPFELTVPLDVTDLPNGRYTVDVNNKFKLTFDLPR